MWEEQIRGKFDYTLTDAFMGFRCGRALFEAFKLPGVRDIARNQPKGRPYPTEKSLGMIHSLR